MFGPSLNLPTIRASRRNNIVIRHRRFTGQTGAVYVETLVVYVPLMLLFFGTFQLGELAAASLVLRRATSAAARAATVVLPDDPARYGTPIHEFAGRRREDIEAAANMIAEAAPQLEDVSVSVSAVDGATTEFTTTVDAVFVCKGAVTALVCGLDGRLPLTHSTTQYYNGAEYVYGN